MRGADGAPRLPDNRIGTRMFNKNEAGWDRALRAVIGVTLVALLLATDMLTGGVAIAGWIVAVAMLGTAATGFCGLYALVGVNTCATE